jgi:hypothetical protein
MIYVAYLKSPRKVSVVGLSGEESWNAWVGLVLQVETPFCSEGSCTMRTSETSRELGGCFRAAPGC